MYTQTYTFLPNRVRLLPLMVSGVGVLLPVVCGVMLPVVRGMMLPVVRGVLQAELWVTLLGVESSEPCLSMTSRLNSSRKELL